jgi:hypothetical protein
LPQIFFYYINKNAYFYENLTMRKLLLFALIFISAKLGFSQTLTPEEAAKHVGDSVKVCGKIYGGRFFETSNGTPTLLNMGAAYPASPITIVFYSEVRSKMNSSPEIELKDKNVCVSGKVTLHKEKPQIVIYNASQLEVTSK